MAYQSPTQALCAFPALQPAPQHCGDFFSLAKAPSQSAAVENLTALWLFFLVSCFLFLVSCILHLASCFLHLASCLLSLASCFLSLASKASWYLLLDTWYSQLMSNAQRRPKNVEWGKIACLVRPSVNHPTVSVYPKMFPVPKEFALSAQRKFIRLLLWEKSKTQNQK